MKKRTAFIGALMSLMPVGQPLVIGTGVVFTSAATILAIPEKVQAESASYYYNRGIEKNKGGDYYGAIADYTRAIELDPRYGNAFGNRGITKKKLGDMKGACSDWRESASLGEENAAQFVRNEC